MPSLPHIKVCQLKDATRGAFLSVQDPNGQLVFGVRAAILGPQPSDQELPSFVELERQNDGRIGARYRPTHGGLGWAVYPGTDVIEHTTDWSIHTSADNWKPQAALCQYTSDNSGLLLLDRRGRYGLVVSGGGSEVAYLELKTWTLEKANAGQHVSARTWWLSLPGIGAELAWPLGAPPGYSATPKPPAPAGE
jgi:hypothetical protein